MQLDDKAFYVAKKTEELFWQIYVQDVAKDGLGTGPDLETLKDVYNSIKQTVSLFRDIHVVDIYTEAQKTKSQTPGSP
jgi:hypothetical protein